MRRWAGLGVIADNLINIGRRLALASLWRPDLGRGSSWPGRGVSLCFAGDRKSMKKIQVLLAEDNRGDVLLVREALAAHHLSYELHVAADGAEAMDFVGAWASPDKRPERTI
jgi:hypothetical protein